MLGPSVAVSASLASRAIAAVPNAMPMCPCAGSSTVKWHASRSAQDTPSKPRTILVHEPVAKDRACMCRASVGAGASASNSNDDSQSRSEQDRIADADRGSDEAWKRAIERTKRGTTSARTSAPWQHAGYRDAYVSQLDPAKQAAIVIGLTVLGGVLTYLTHTSWGPWVCARSHWLTNYLGTAPYIFALLYIASGVLHFTHSKLLERIFPHTGAWGFWRVPGKAKLHVEWTGFAEICGGLGVLLGHLGPSSWLMPHWLEPISALGLFVLTIVVTPANIYMWTHNASPLDRSLSGQPDPPLPQWWHAARGLLQVVLLSTWLGLTRATWLLIKYW